MHSETYQGVDGERSDRYIGYQSVMEQGAAVALASEPDIREAVGEVLTFAAKLIGSQEGAMRWLGTPVRALNYATPISLLARPEGKEAVLGVLHRSEYGVF